MTAKAEEKVADLIIGGFKIIQNAKLYRFNIDSVLLAHFAEIEQGEHVVDLGAGEGVLGLILLARQPDISVLGLEVNEKACTMLERTIVLNNLTDRYVVKNMNIKSVYTSIAKGTADLVICNPPYYKIGTGKIGKNEDIAQARHEIAANLKDFVAAGAYMLNENGRFIICHLSERLPELIRAFAECNMVPVKMRTVYSSYEAKAGIVMLESVLQKKQGNRKMEIMPPLYIYENKNLYTEEVKSYYR